MIYSIISLIFIIIALLKLDKFDINSGTILIWLGVLVVWGLNVVNKFYIYPNNILCITNVVLTIILLFRMIRKFNKN